MTRLEASIRYNVSEQTISNWVKEGAPCNVHFQGLRKTYTFEPESLDLWVKNHRSEK